MSEVIERAERAFCKAIGRDYDAYQGYYREAIRAAIESMREPTEAMRDAGLNMVVKEQEACRAAGTKGWSYSSVDIAWDAMIAAALKES